LQVKQSFCPLGNLHWVTKTASGSSVIEMPMEVGQLYQKALVLGKGRVAPQPVAQRRSTSYPISGWRNLDRTARQCDHSKLTAERDDPRRYRSRRRLQFGARPTQYDDCADLEQTVFPSWMVAGVRFWRPMIWKGPCKRLAPGCRL
jgi:hypothetical protein